MAIHRCVAGAYKVLVHVPMNTSLIFLYRAALEKRDEWDQQAERYRLELAKDCEHPEEFRKSRLSLLTQDGLEYFQKANCVPNLFRLVAGRQVDEDRNRR